MGGSDLWWQRFAPKLAKPHKGIHKIELKFLAGIQLNPFTPKSDLIDLILSKARRFYLSKGDPLGVKELTPHQAGGEGEGGREVSFVKVSSASFTVAMLACHAMFVGGVFDEL